MRALGAALAMRALLLPALLLPALAAARGGSTVRTGTGTGTATELGTGPPGRAPGAERGAALSCEPRGQPRPGAERRTGGGGRRNRSPAEGAAPGRSGAGAGRAERGRDVPGHPVRNARLRDPRAELPAVPPGAERREEEEEEEGEGEGAVGALPCPALARSAARQRARR